ncbi:universal stress protein [Nocardioides sp. PD653-B2]|nr:MULTISPECIES: universal stress protein [unclassified Nocardioides]GAW47957.1 UspA domain-containing protein [Nocardioides sp. PD653-B2]GAW53740.1 UspA domain-containing protein [Nocardioides sp. PD653]
MLKAVFELGSDGPRQILVGVDGSPSSLNAGSYAAGLARRQSSRLVALYVATHSRFTSAMAASAGIALPAEADEYAEELGRLVHDRAAQIGIAIQFERRFGDPYEQLMTVATELRVDAIVVGASRQHGNPLVGSLAARLVKTARWPVTVVP